MLPITLPEFNPIAIAIGPIAIRWYSLAYIAGILFTLFWLKKCNKKNPILSKEAYDDWLFFAVISILLGGRIGYILFYNFSFFLQNPLEIFAFWHGGMSFHGGLLGAICGMWFFAKKYRVDFLKLTDVLAIAAPVGLFFGRLANFINLELYGRVTGSNFGVIFPNAGDLPRYPSQIFEAALEGVLLFLTLFSLNYFTKIRQKRGALSGLFLALYGTFRISLEHFREPDPQIGFLFNHITMGQLLSWPLILVGIILIFSSRKVSNNPQKI